ncbi:hypothetical protein SK224_16625 [Microbacterium sp. BG28]|uniref:hypothetical protein n=1 Tax=Microbacterium sp. BG28 TaxID=3097356 RepID=UPI002A59B0B8|nr:hypothetical protein [Microbacterium sp. BG28]MDY0830762.1 hypothetical protein [Microbacterium sp. BG28]
MANHPATPAPATVTFGPLAGTQMRWLVRLEPAELPHLGTVRRDLLVWTVRPWVRVPNGTKHGERRIGRIIAQHEKWALAAAVAKAMQACGSFYDVPSVRIGSIADNHLRILGGRR